jgi:osmotically-inducible protein OsmY
MAQPEEAPTMGSTTAAMDDQELKEKIQSTLEGDPSLSNVTENVQIETMDGKVTLRGSAPSAQEKEHIATKVQQMEGVQEVDNQLQVANR